MTTGRQRSGAGCPWSGCVFLRDGAEVFRTYFTTGRGVEALGSNWTFLDLTPLDRQEIWEDSPEGWPLRDGHRRPPYEWWRLHNEYPAAPDGPVGGV